MRLKLQNSLFLKDLLLATILIFCCGHPIHAQCTVEQSQKLLADDGASEDRFGNAVAIDGSIAIVGANTDDGNGNSFTGSAYLFDTTTGEQIVKLLPASDSEGGEFGKSVSIHGNKAIVGEPWDNESGLVAVGAAYLFNASTGQQIAKLRPHDVIGGHNFGMSVALSETIAVIGARGDDANGDAAGAAYLFDTTTGLQIDKILPEDGATEDIFGLSVAISGDTAIVGATGDDDNGLGSGSAYLFNTTTGQQIAKLVPDDGAAGDQFGFSVAIHGTIAIVGAKFDDDNGETSGSAYLFDTNTGQQITKLLADDGAAGDAFGHSCDIIDTIAIVGARSDDDNGNATGSAYLFNIPSGAQIAKVLPNDAVPAGSQFGTAVAISGTMAIIGARGDDGNGEDSGSAYLFDISCSNSEIVHADQFNVFRGFHLSGVLSDSFESDDSYLKFNPGFTINSAEAPVWLIFDGTLPSDNPASLQIVMESNAGTPGLTHTLEAWNWTSAAYDIVDVSVTGFNNDVVVTVDLSSGITDYSQSGTGAVRTRVGWRKTGLIINFPWEVRLDQMIWTAGN